ncbi:MAG: FtsX-like permease family protein [Cyclobacteriaceae bacterium]|nr:FtsX-like permease family protein [Cyclobacteriaceae bacterium]
MAKNWGISALKLFSLTTGMLSLLLIQLFYFDYSESENNLYHVWTHGNFESIALLMVILSITVFVYLVLISNQIASRAREFFIRKLYGAGSFEIVAVLLVEAFLFLLVSFILSLALIDQLSPLFNRFTGRQVNISNNQNDIGLVTGAFLFIVPAFLMMLLPAMRCAGWRAVEFLKKLSG